MSRKKVLTLLSVLTLVLASAVYAGKVELTTYYPAPFGEYQKLQATGSDSEDGNLALRASGTDTANPGLAVTNANNVGIGTATPTAKLDVVGDVRATRLGIGDVPNRNGDFRLASQAGNPSNWPAGAQGQVAYSSDNNALFVSNGTSWTSASAGGIRTYGAVLTGRKNGISVAWTDVGLKINVRPSSANSKFLINANTNMGNNGNECCEVGLFRGNTPLVAPFASAHGWGVVNFGVSYLDADNSGSIRTYNVKMRGDCYFNSGYKYDVVSSMTVLETQN